MNQAFLIDDTICALSTPEGTCAIAVIRLSGPDAIPIASKVITDTDLTRAKGYTIHYGQIVNKKQIIDEVLVSVFRKPHSYTGEDMVEISCHGSVHIVRQIMMLLNEAGARPAMAGEFTRKAFVNGKFDLSQAEAVADLIAANSASAHKIAIDQLKGNITKMIDNLRDRLAEFLSLIELELDFGEEDVEFANRKELTQLLEEILGMTANMISSFSAGNAIKNGIPVVISGKPNAGKSTLLNALLKEERAIVSDIPGTTRDSIEETLNLDGQIYRFIDTAGLRPSDDPIEHLSILKTYEKIRHSSIIIYLFDINKSNAKEIETDIKQIRKSAGDNQLPIITIGNKTDLASEKQRNSFEGLDVALFISAFSQQDIQKVVNAVKEEGHGLLGSTEGVMLSNARHLHAFIQAEKALKETKKGIKERLSEELLAEHIKDALYHLSSITGKVGNKDILDAIFSRFCIGK